ncbi:LPS translocon maturation chaperone LptM [Dyella subtropica]|uniref:LPS translocon maturation chaperone LptM n=1 Tax=Dyella subtropica TaxID=2992127 RepID=UPI00225B11CF|nr:lipoprotein [Dyella subtropica]
MRRSILLLPLCFVMASLAGCGNKGPLYMPAPKPTPTPAAATVAPASAATAAAPVQH